MHSVYHFIDCFARHARLWLHHWCLCVLQWTFCAIVVQNIGLQLHLHHICDTVCVIHWQSVLEHQKLYYISLLNFGWRHIHPFRDFTFATCNIYPRLATNFLNWLVVTYHTSHNTSFMPLLPRCKKKNMQQNFLTTPHISNSFIYLYRKLVVLFWPLSFLLCK